MGKRSNLPRRFQDKYRTPFEAVLPLRPFLPSPVRFTEPCAGDGRLVMHLQRLGHTPCRVFDTAPDDLFMSTGDALVDDLGDPDQIITNPPWTRELLHPMIVRFASIAPTWLLFDGDWSNDRPGAPVSADLFAYRPGRPREMVWQHDRDGRFRLVSVRCPAYWNNSILQFRLDDTMIVLDAWRRNPVPCKLVKKTPTGGVIADDDHGIRYYVPPDQIDARVIVPDLLSPLMPWEQ